MNRYKRSILILLLISLFIEELPGSYLLVKIDPEPIAKKPNVYRSHKAKMANFLRGLLSKGNTKCREGFGGDFVQCHHNENIESGEWGSRTYEFLSSESSGSSSASGSWSSELGPPGKLGPKGKFRPKGKSGSKGKSGPKGKWVPTGKLGPKGKWFRGKKIPKGKIGPKVKFGPKKVKMGPKAKIAPFFVPGESGVRRPFPTSPGAQPKCIGCK